MAIVNIASADTITILVPVCEISGTTQVNTILGVKDGSVLKIWPTGAFAFGAAGNIIASTVAQVSGTPVFLFCRGGVLTQVGVVGYGSTGTGNLVRETSPTIVTPTIASFTNATHNHTNAAGGGQLASSAFAAGDKTGTGKFVLATNPTIETPTIASFTNATHNHTNAAGGGQLTSAAINGVTGTGNVVLATNPTIDDLVITTRIRLPGPVYIYSGSGTPEGAVTAPIGSTFHRTNGGAGTSFYVKESGSGNTGWRAV